VTAYQGKTNTLLALLVGLGAHSLNWLAIPLGYGLDLIPGMVLVYVGALLFPAVPALLIAVFALAPTLWHWGIPWAGLVITLEVAFVLLLKDRFRKIPLPAIVLLYWATFGALAWATLVSFKLDLNPVSAGLIVVKQALNDILAASLAALVIAIAVRREKIRTPSTRTQLYSTLNIVLNSIVGFLLIPGLLALVVLGNNIRESTQNDLEADARQALELLEHDFALLLDRERSMLDDFWRTRDTGFHDTPNQDPARLDRPYWLQGRLGALDIAKCEPHGAAARHSARSPHLTRPDQLTSLVCHWAQTRPAGALYLNQSTDHAHQVVVWTTVTQQQNTTALFTVLSAEALFSHAHPGLSTDKVNILAYDDESRLVHTTSTESATNIESLFPGFPPRDETPPASLVLGAGEETGEAQSKMTRWLDAKYLETIDSNQVEGLALTAFVDAAGTINAYRETFLLALTSYLLILAFAIVILTGAGRLLSRKLKPYLDNLFLLSSNADVADIPSRIIELDCINDKITAASERIKRSADSKEASERRLKNLIHASPAVIWEGSGDRDLGVIFEHITPSIKELTHLNRVRSRKDILNSVHPSDQGAFVAFNKTLVLQGRASVQYRVKAEAGKDRWLYEEARVISQPVSHDSVFSGMILDISDLKHAEEQIEKQARLATLGDMTSGVAHELNQPLQVIQLASDNALDALEPEADSAAREYVTARLNKIQSQAARASEIINAMRSLARDNDGVKAELDLRDIAWDVLGFVGEKIKSSDIDIEVSTINDVVLVHANRAELVHMTINLIFNSRDAIVAARKSADQQTDMPNLNRIRVEVVSHPVPNTGCIVVQDRAGGVPENEIDRIFEPFFTTKDPARHSGIGLPVSHWAAKQNQGSLVLKNHNKGLRARACFPISKRNP